MFVFNQFSRPGIIWLHGWVVGRNLLCLKPIHYSPTTISFCNNNVEIEMCFIMSLPFIDENFILIIDLWA